MKRFVVNKKRHFPLSAQFFVMLIVVFLLVLYLNNMQGSRKDQEKIILEKAITRSLTQCYAMEGFYPEDLSYLTDHYGLTYNHKDFLVDYQYVAGNLRPDITIIERK